MLSNFDKLFRMFSFQNFSRQETSDESDDKAQFHSHIAIKDWNANRQVSVMSYVLKKSR